MQTELVLDTSALHCTLRLAAGIELVHFGLPGYGAAGATSGMFGVEIGGHRIDGHTTGLTVVGVSDATQGGRRHVTIHTHHVAAAVAIDLHLALYEGTALIESWIEVENRGSQVQRITRLDSFALDLPVAAYRLLSFTGSWGLEFEPHTLPLNQTTMLESRAGRSSKGHHPWLALERADGMILSAAVAWSGNWVLRSEVHSDGRITLSGGLHDWEFAVDLAPGARIAAPPVVLVLAHGDLNAISAQYAAVGRSYWYPRAPLADQLPVEWNHWWSYEDRAIDEETFRANIDVAARLGMEVCALDAGWFGPTDAGTHWYDYRGDWDLVNEVRFPSGIRALSDYVHEQGMAFGLWCEIEGLGKEARLAETHPELVAQRDGERLGYVCLGSEAGRAWAFATLDRLIDAYRCDWIKLDFNLDPEAGCNRTDHGHGAGNGLYAHYQGYYELLERIRSRYPHVVLENCSSGGLRIDLGIARQTHMAFLSDPDWPEHSLQLFWGASTMLAPEALLHWGYCEWAFAEHRMQKFDPRDPALTRHQIDYYTRISMLRRFGFSQKLPDLPAWVAERYREHIAIYKAHVRRIMPEADLIRLSAQPQRFGLGDRWAAFQYRMPGDSEHLLAVFRLPGGEPSRSFLLHGIDPSQQYELEWLGDDRKIRLPGTDLASNGLTFTELPEEGSALIRIALTA
ncbi:MAG TPA: alpha-galactosidase [Roseiflexaceae bacterium]|nr:alpha-galactosidase [Roseiflexaceae bacterium]